MNHKRIISLLLVISVFRCSAFAAETLTQTLYNQSHREESYASEVLIDSDDRQLTDIINKTVSDRYIIKYNADDTTLLNEKIESKMKDKTIRVDDIEEISADINLSENEDSLKLVQLNEAVDIDKFVSEVTSDNSLGIEYVQPDYKLQISTSDNEFNVATSMVEKFEVSRDESESSTEVQNTLADNDNEVVVAVIDTGIDITHSNLSNILWHNEYEQEDDVDDDMNGYIDDIIGWDFVEHGQLTYDSSLSVDYTHGTHVAGIIGDFNNECNNINIRIMPLRTFTNGSAYTSDIIEAIQYAEMMGAKIVNCSFGSTEENMALKQVIENSDMLFVCAVGNNRLDVSETPIYPACYGFDNIVSVAATNDRNYISYFSNYGNDVDIAADGCSIQSIVPDNKTGYSSGTSMATAYVSKAIATIVSMGVDSNDDVKNILFNTADHISSLEGKTYDMRKVNISNILNNIINNEVIINDKDDYLIDTTTSDVIDKDFSLYGLKDTNIDAISAGGYHSTILIDGKVYAFGDDHYCQVSGLVYAGEGDIPAPGFCDIYSVKKISTRGDHTLVLMQDGTVRAWGRNDYGQLGDGTVNEYITDGYYLAEQVYGLSNIVDIAAGHDFSLALDSQGRVYAWGNNKGGKLGVGSSYEAYLTPVQVSALSDIKQISAGHYHALALSKSGTVYGWGNNSNGEFGKSTYSNYTSPTVIDIPDVKKVVAGFNNSFFIKTDGTTYGCGQNSDGQLGDGSMEEKKSIIKIPIEGVTDISSTGTTIFLKDNGEVYGCGLNVYGQLGQGNTSYRYTSLVKIPGEYSQISEGGNHTLLLSTDGLLYSMGRNHKLQCGFGEKYEIITAPKLVDAFSESALTIDNITVDYQTNKVVLTGEFNIPDNRRNWYVKYTDKTNQVRSEAVSMIIEDETYIAKFTPRLAADGVTQAKLYYDGYVSNGDYEYEYDFEFNYLAQNVKNKTGIAYLPTDDTYVSQHSEDYNANFNDSQFLSVNYTRREGGTDLWGRYSLLRFNIDDIDKSHLLSAKLRLYVDESSDVRNSNRTVSIYDIDNEWDATQITWGNKNIEIGSEPIGQFDVTGTGWAIQNPGWKEIDITKYIYDLDESEISLFAKMTSTDAHPINIRSSEHEDELTRPELVIEYLQRDSLYDYNIQVSGQTDANKDLLVRVFRPDNSIETIEQLHSDIHGHYYYSHHVGWENKGTYQTIVSTEGKSQVDYFTTDLREKSEIDKIIINEPEQIIIPQSDLRVSIATAHEKSYLMVRGTITNNDTSDEQDNMVFMGVYNEKSELVNYATVSANTIGIDPFAVVNQIALPEGLENYDVRVFVCEGRDLYSGSMSLLSQTYTIPSNNVMALMSTDDISANDIESVDTPLIIKDNMSRSIGLMSIPLISNTTGLKIDISIMNNGRNTERLLKNNCNLGVLYTLTNTSDDNIDVTPILAFYRQGWLYNFNTGYSEMILRPHSTVNYSSEYTLVSNNLTTDTAKIMVWNRLSGMMPYIDVISLTGENQDFYGDTFDTAGKVTLNGGFEGVIDSGADIDIVKFKPTTTALYTFNYNCNDDLLMSLYNLDEAEIMSTNLIDSGSYSVVLSADTEYYMKLTSKNNTACKYSFTDVSVLLPDLSTIQITEWGLYTIGTQGRFMSVYDSDYNLITEGNTSGVGLSYVELNTGTYYVNVVGEDDYTPFVTKEEVPDLMLGEGVAGELIRTNQSRLYKFTPPESGTYIISSTGNCALEAYFYSDVYSLLANANNDNYNNNFSIKRNLDEGTTYYLKIKSKNGIKSNYTLHVELPLEIVSID